MAVTDRSLQDGIENVSAELASIKKATDRIMAKSPSPAFRQARDCLGVLSEKVETSASVLTPTRTQTFSR